MNFRVFSRVLVVAALIATGCGSSAVPVAVKSVSSPRQVQTPSPSPTGAPSPRPGVCMAPSHPCLALATLRGSNQIVVRDVTDIAHPKTVGTLGPNPDQVGYGQPSAEFVNATELSYVGGDADPFYGLPTGLFRRSVAGSAGAEVVKGSQAVMAFAWAPDGSALTYLTAGTAGMDLHQLRGGQDRVVASLPPLPAGGCEVSPCPGPFQNPADNWDFRLAYSPDGASISLVQNGIRSLFRLWTSAGAPIASADDAGRTMSVWSGSALFFRDSTGVQMWHDGLTSSFLPGVAWIRPKASADGSQIVFEARDAQGSAHVYVVDVGSRKVRDLGKSRAEGAFLTDRYVWYQSEASSGKTYIYDLESATEAESIITAVFDVWPHGA